MTTNPHNLLCTAQVVLDASVIHMPFKHKYCIKVQQCSKKVSRESGTSLNFAKTTEVIAKYVMFDFEQFVMVCQVGPLDHGKSQDCSRGVDNF